VFTGTLPDGRPGPRPSWTTAAASGRGQGPWPPMTSGLLVAECLLQDGADAADGGDAVDDLV
jgi:hypothetical protein